MSTPLIDVCTITELQEFLQVKPSELWFPKTFKEEYKFWNEVPYHSESALLHRLQEIEDEVKEKRLVNYVNSCIIQNYQRIYLPAREKESTM
jgi:hypothetical protein